MEEAARKVVYRIVLTNGLVITVGELWPGPDGKPLVVNGVQIPGEVWQIHFVPDIVESYEDGDGAETEPAHYKVFMRKQGGGPLENSAGGRETQVYTFYTQQVMMVGWVYEWDTALKEIKELMGLDLPDGNGAQKQPVAEAST